MATNETTEGKDFGTTDADTDADDAEMDPTRTPAWTAPTSDDEGCWCDDEDLACYAHYERERTLRGEHR